MQTQSRLILFCYAYVLGIVYALAFTIDPAHLPLLRILTAFAFLVSVPIYVRFWMKGALSRVPLLAELVLLSLPAFALGCTRYTRADTVPDERIGILQVLPERPQFVLERELPDTSRLILRKTEPLAGDLVLRIHGDLSARVPLLDQRGLVRTDDAGRWMFRRADLERQSDPVTIRADDPVGTEYLVLQPFNRISRIEVIRAPDDATVELYRVSNHISSFARPGRAQAPVTIIGRITQDPRVYDFKTVLTVTPEYIQYPPGGPYYRVEGGDVHVDLRPRIENYERYARTDAYGHLVQVYGELSVARAAANPGGFDPRRFLQNHGIYGGMSVFQAPGGAPPIQMIMPDLDESLRGNGLVRFSLDLRDRMLRVFKMSMPYPQSSFLGGVTLGLRYGLHGVTCLLGHDHDPDTAPVCEEFIAEEFRYAGVNHVLAVSGLHVTIITVMFMGIFTMVRIPRQMYVPLVILILIIFAIITGARPSVLRAVIMNSLFLLTWGYLHQGLRSSVLIGVPVAAFLILLQNPLVIVDPSFTLSFGAILSLGLLTEPAHHLLQRLEGNGFLAFALIFLILTGIGVVFWPLVVTPQFLIPFALAAAALAGWLRKLEQRGVRLIGSLGYNNIPAAVGAFLAAQFAIQIGMMIPLSSYYFMRWPFAGAYANLIAIPLIGIVVQLGVIAGLMGLIPVIGLYLALLLNAANWIFASAFLLLAHYFTIAFPYPFVTRPSISFLISYFIFCAAFIWHQPLWEWIRGQCERRGYQRRSAPWIVAALLALLATTPMWRLPARAPAPELNITFLSMGYGTSALVESPGGRRLLIDAGFVQHDLGRNNDATRTILPYLSHHKIRHLDAVFLTSPLPQRVAGASYLLEHVWVDQLHVIPALAGLTTDMTYESFVDRLTGGRAVERYNADPLRTMYNEVIGYPLHPRRPSLVKSVERRTNTALNRWAGWNTEVKVLREGDVLFREQVNGKEFRVEVLAPFDQPFDEHPIENATAALRIVYGDFAVLFGGDLHYAGQRHLAAQRPERHLRSDILVVPHQGTAIPWCGPREDQKLCVERRLAEDTAPLLAKVKPERTVFTYGYPRPVLGMAGRNAEHVFELTWRYYSDRLGETSGLRTDRDLAIFIRSDGKTYDVSTQMERNREAGADYAIDDLQIGF